MSDIWFTSDNHFFHKNMIKYCPDSRRFSDIKEMNEKMIDQWNSQVKSEDIVYCLGDFSFGDPEKTLKILDRINGNIFLIKGNHDHLWINRETQKRLSAVSDYKRVVIDNIRVILFHYPIAKWDCQDHGAYHLYGHVHGSFALPGRAMDVGVDTKDNCGLYSWVEIHHTLKDKPIVGHH